MSRQEGGSWLGRGFRFRAAFTLAEVLITLGIIGVVAAMTMPALIQKNNNRIVETRLMKFYSSINQAVKMTEVDYGDKAIWWADLAGAIIDGDGNPIPGSSESEKWFNKYLAPYLKITSMETLSDGTFIAYFPDGSALKQMHNGTTRDWLFYSGNPKKCINDFGFGYGKSLGKCAFALNFQPESEHFDWRYHFNKGFEPWKWAWDGSRDTLVKGCKTEGLAASPSGQYCTALIQYNGWKIPDDYPHKVSY